MAAGLALADSGFDHQCVGSGRRDLSASRPEEAGGKGWPLAPALLLTIVITILVAGWLAKKNDIHEAAPVGDNS